MPVLLIDCESFGTADLKKVGSDFYNRHAETETLLWSIRAFEWPRSLVFEVRDFWPLILELKAKKQLEWPSGEELVLVSWGSFDRLRILQETVPKGIEVRWSDLQAVSQSYGGPAKLADAAVFWSGEQTKDDGKHLIARFCKPQKDGSRIHPADDPVRWERFRSYAGQDTNVMVGIWEALAWMTQNGGHGWALHRPAWEAVWRMNERGIPVDREAAARATLLLQSAENELARECKETYGILPSQTGEVTALLGLPDIRKETLEVALEGGYIAPELERLAEIRLEVAGAARKKLTPMLAMTTDENPRVRGSFVYHGAWTRRLTARGMQPQNMVREKSDPAFFEALRVAPEAIEDPFEAVRKNIRGFIAAEPGNVLVAADFSQIELRIGAWLAGAKTKLDAMAAGKDVYKETAASLFRVPIAEIKKPSRERDLGKVTDLSCIFQVGGERLASAARAKPYSIEITDEEGARVVADWRALNPEFVDAWEEMRDGFMDCARGHLTEIEVLGGKVRLEKHPWGVKLVRPSGFGQYYFDAKVVEGRWPDGGSRWELAYVGLDASGKMAPQRTYGGNLFQNAVQGTAADLMFEAMLRAEENGFLPVMSVHDEIVCEIGYDGGFDYSPMLCEIISVLPDWAAGLPVEAEGWQSKRFTK